MRPPKLCPGLVRNHAAIPAFNGRYETHLAKIRIAYLTGWRARLYGAARGIGHGQRLITNILSRPRRRTLLASGVWSPVSRRAVG